MLKVYHAPRPRREVVQRMWYTFRGWWARKVRPRLYVKLILGQWGDIVIRPECKLADMWIGIFWRVERSKYHDNFGTIEAVELWGCIIPCLPLHIKWRRWEEDVPF